MHLVYTPNTQEIFMVSARMEINDYTNKVLNVIKVKHDLKDKSEALNKFAEICGEIFVEKKPSDEYVKRVLRIAKNYEKNRNRKMTIKELDKLCGVDS